MASFNLKLLHDRNLMTQLENLNRELPNLPPGFVIQLRVHHQNNNPVLRRPPISKPDEFLYVLDSVFLSYHGMLNFLFNILSGEGIQFENDGRFSRPYWLRILQANTSRSESVPIYTIMHFAECLRRYALLLRYNIHTSSAKLMPLVMDLTISHQQFHFSPSVEEIFVLHSQESFTFIESNVITSAVRLVEGIIETSSSTENCSICLESFDVGQLTFCTPCAHIFHKKCITPWVKKRPSCPLCRANLSIHG